MRTEREPGHRRSEHPEAEGPPAQGPLTVLEALAEAARLVPPGRAVSYGALAGLLGVGGPRQAGRAMAESGPGTPWWRGLRAGGALPEHLAAPAARQHEREGTPRRRTSGVDMAGAAWHPTPAQRRALEALAARTR